MDDEARLIREVVGRDPTAWLTLYERHHEAVFGLIHHLVGGNRHIAEEIDQEVWLLAIEKIAGFDPNKGRLRDWLLGIARHRALRHFRQAMPRSLPTQADVPLDELSSENVADPFLGRFATPTAPELAEGGERASVVRAALISLQEGSRSVLLAKYAEGLSVEQIAARIGRTAKAVESLLSRGREQLRTLLAPYFSPTTNESPPIGGQHHEPLDARTTR